MLRLDRSMLTKNLVLNHKLVQHLDKAIGKEDFVWSAEFKPKEGDSAFHPSGHCLPSAYELYTMASSVGEVSAPSSSLKKAFMVGHFWHAYIQYLLVERLEFATWSDIERRGRTIWGRDNSSNPKPFHWATGNADVAPCNIPIHGAFLLDIKTMNLHDFRSPKLPNWCAAKYECQVNVYMDWFDLDRAMILCVQKDSPHDFKEVTFKRNQALIDALYGKWKLVSECLDQGVIPDEDYHVELPIEGPCVF